jgi:hypothetical protein
VRAAVADLAASKATAIRAALAQHRPGSKVLGVTLARVEGHRIGFARAKAVWLVSVDPYGGAYGTGGPACGADNFVIEIIDPATGRWITGAAGRAPGVPPLPILGPRSRLPRGARCQVAATVPATVPINPNIGETFAPAPPSAAPALTAQQAWHRYAEQARSRNTTIPSFVIAQLGLFTLKASPPGDPETAGLPGPDGKFYTPRNELPYGYSWHSCPPVMGVPSPGPRAATTQSAPARPSATSESASAPRPPNPCVAWLFLDANTGRMIVQTWQQ